MNSGSYSICLSPTRTLYFLHEGEVVTSLKNISKAFDKDWRLGWFMVAAEKLASPPTLSFRFWQGIAAHYLANLCHSSQYNDAPSYAIPDHEQLIQWVASAPPMVGGEYLSVDTLKALWSDLNHWVMEEVTRLEGVPSFLAQYAPQWLQVGRVCFHLAENKKNPDQPFAFLATYSTSIGEGGRLKHLPLKQALKQYSDSTDKQALIKLLTPIHNASQKCPWVQQLLSTAELYQPLAWSANKAYQFLSSIPHLEESGLQVRIPNWWKQRPRPQVKVTIGASKQSGLGVDSLLDFNIHMALGDDLLSEEELQQILSSEERLISLRGQWVEVNKEQLQQALQHWKLIKNNAKHDGISFIEGMRLLAGAPADLNEEPQSEELREWVKIAPSKELEDLLQKLLHPTQLSLKGVDGLSVDLRPYQHEGVEWLLLLSELGLGACLADDMGLGKTIQILGLLLHQKRSQEVRAPSLLVVPASLLGNWKREAEKFTPSLNLLLLHPSETKKLALSDLEKSQWLTSVDCVVTTYSMVTKLEWLSTFTWNLLILDEAQAIKNSGTKQARAVKGLKCRARVALTGTPIENRLSDLWSLFDFLNPGLLGSAKRFKDYVGALQGSEGQFQPLRKLVRPYILRRMKTDPKIISDLPEKIETAAYCYLTKDQARHYQSIVNELTKTLETMAPANRRGAVLKTLLELKQICNHPSQYTGSGEYNPVQSGKFERLGQLCEELASRQEKVLIFTQFSELIPHLEEYLSKIFGRRGLILHGGTPIKERKELVDAFQNEQGPPFFVLSLKAGGTGLTLTAASHVIHFDRWWNPAVENQATDRAFRIGQKKNVQVHKFITQGTVEEQIDAIIMSKKKEAEDILGPSDEVKITELSNHELLKILTLDIDRATAN